MLKIKDDVDLKELEKFGFKLDNNEWYTKNNNGFIIYIKPLSRKITLKTYEGSLRENVDILYDLIQANLVEKI